MVATIIEMEAALARPSLTELGPPPADDQPWRREDYFVSVDRILDQAHERVMRLKGNEVGLQMHHEFRSKYTCVVCSDRGCEFCPNVRLDDGA